MPGLPTSSCAQPPRLYRLRVRLALREVIMLSASLRETATTKGAKLAERKTMTRFANRKGLVVLAGAAVLFSGVALAQSRSEAQTGSAASAVDALVGRWARTEGPYMITI